MYKEKILKSVWCICLTEEGGEKGEDTHTRSIFGQFQTSIKSELIGISIRGKRDPPRIVCIYSETHEINNQVEWKSRIKMGKMAGNGQGILAILTTPPISFLDY